MNTIVVGMFDASQEKLPLPFKAFGPNRTICQIEYFFHQAEIMGTGMAVGIWQFPKIGGPQYRPQNTIILIIGTPKKVPLILGNPYIA